MFKGLLSRIKITAQNRNGSRNAMDALQHSIAGALEAEQRKTQVNDAKLRAVAQRVDYDEFCKMVAGAHLKPVKPCSAESRDISRPFDQFVLPKYEPATDSVDRHSTRKVEHDAEPPAFSQPSSSHEFLRTWRRSCRAQAERLRYLRVLDIDTLPMLFRTEMDPLLLDAFVDTLHVAVCEREPSGDGSAEAAAIAQQAPLALWAVRLLAGLARVNRFDATLNFAAGPTTDKLKRIFAAAASHAPAEGVAGNGELDAAAVAALASKFGIRDVVEGRGMV